MADLDKQIKEALAAADRVLERARRQAERQIEKDQELAQRLNSYRPKPVPSTSSMGTAFRFDGRNPAAQRVAERQAARFVTRIMEETRAAIRSLITRSIRDGIAPRDAARAIRSMVGMNEQQAQAAANYRASLIELGLPLDKVEAKVEAYTAKKIRERALTIARTETMGALNEGARESWREAQDEGLLSKDAVVEWMVTPDELLCPICAPMDEVQVKLGEKFQTSEGPLDGPPAHPNCLTGDALVAACGRVAASSERRYDGDLLVIHTARGYELACSPNHPILTPRGWLAARALHVGGHVIGSRFREWETSRRDMDDQNVPARFHDVAEAARRSQEMATTPVPLAPEDFHGDGRGSEVAVVWTNRLLSDGFDSTGTEHRGQVKLRWAGMQALGLARHSTQREHGLRIALSAACPMCGRYLGGARQRVHRLPLQALGLTLASEGDPALGQTAHDERARDAKLARELIDGSAGQVMPDQVVALNSLKFHGLLFNMETATGAYWANGILTHNCRCSSAATEPDR